MTSITDTLFCLAQQTSQPATAPGLQELPASMAKRLFVNGTLSLGVCVLLFWMACRLVNPGKFLLRDTPGRPNRLGIPHVGLLVAAMYLLYPAAAVGVKKLFEWCASPLAATDLPVMVGMAIATPILIPLTLLVAHIGFRHGIRSGLGLNCRHWLCDSVRGVAGVLAIYPVCAVLLWLSTQYLIPQQFQRIQTPLTLIQDPLVGAGWKALIVVLAVALVPVSEELLFRGILQSAFRRVLRNPWAAIVLTSVIFASVHLSENFTGAQNLLPLFALSLTMGYNYERCGRLWPSILMHMLFNAFTMIVNLWPAP